MEKQKIEDINNKTLEIMQLSNDPSSKGYSKKIFFIHVGKTAGSSFNRFLSRNFNGEEHCEQYLAPDRKTLLYLERLKSFDYISGHLKLDVFTENEFQKENYFLISFLRDPIDQLISHLNWIIYIYENPVFFNQHPIEIQTISQELGELDLYKTDIFISKLQEFWGLFQNNQSRYFITSISTDFEQIVEKMSQLDMVGLTEDYEQSLKLFIHLNKLNIEVVVDKENVNSNCRIGRDILDNPLIHEFLQSYNALDVKIYNYFSSKFQALVSEFI